jgi:hypothetical protein
LVERPPGVPAITGHPVTASHPIGPPLDSTDSTATGQCGERQAVLPRVGQLLRLLDTIPHEGGVPESWFEELLAGCLADPAIPPVVAQYPILDRHGALVARVDLAIPSVRLGIEAHSRRYHFGPDAERLDEQRDLAVAAVGWELVYLGWHAAQRPREVRAAIRRIVGARARQV